MRGTRVSEDLVYHAIELYLSGYSCAEVGKLLRRSRSVVWRILKANNINRRSVSEGSILFSSRRTDKHHLWKGGKVTEKQGYIMLRCPNHPRAWPNGYVLEHIVVLEEKLGRPLLPGEVTHHVNEIKGDNTPNNLEAKTNGEHSRYHNSGDKHYTVRRRGVS